MSLPKFTPSKVRIARRVGKTLGAIGCCLVMLPFLMEIIVGIASARHKANTTTCTQNLRVLSAAVLQYSQDWDETLPPSARWEDFAALHVNPANRPKVFHCPETQSLYSYAFNVHLGRAKIERLIDSAHAVMIYEGNTTRFNAAGDGIALPIALRHNVDATIIGYADGHVKVNRSSTFGLLNWESKGLPKSEK